MITEPNRHSVFVVDDEGMIASTFALILRKRGFNARSFTAPHEALQAAESAAPDVLVSDVVMPGMNGIELAIQIRESCPRCRVVLFSGQTATTDLLTEAEAIGHHFEILAKPVHPTVLIEWIEAALLGSESPNTVAND